MTHESPKSKRRPAPASSWAIELHTELSGAFFYRYRRLVVARTGRRCSVRELVFHLEYDHDQYLLTKPRQMVRQRGRGLTVSEAETLWRRIARVRRRLDESYPCLDDTRYEELDSAQVDGIPVAVHVGEEGPACLTLRSGRERAPLQRVVIDRFRQPSCDGEAGPGSPLARIVSMLDPGLANDRPLTYRRTQTLPDLVAAFERLKAVDFLNLRQFERRFADALGWLGDPAAVPILTGELFAADPSVRCQALDSLANIGDGAARPDVELLCYDDDPTVREHAREAIERLGSCVMLGGPEGG